jgi:ABC-type multidrug transport system permease subunit
MRDDVAVAIIVFVLIMVILGLFGWYGYDRWYTLD